MIIGRQSGLGRGLGALIPPKPQTAATAGRSSSSAFLSESDDAASVVPAKAGADGMDPGFRRDDGFTQVESVPAESSVSSGSFAASHPSAPDSLLAAVERGSMGTVPDAAHTIHDLPLEQVDPNPHQPRRHFDHSQLEDLITSIKEHGVLQPIVVTEKTHGRYELIAGERRLRASKIAGRETIPAIIRSATEQQKLELAIIENIQRQQLNALEEAESYLRLQDEFNLTQEQVADKVGKSRSQVANTIRLLQLPEEIKQALVTGKITASNARTLLSVQGAEQMKLFQEMLDGNFTVRQTEARIPHRRPRKASFFDANIQAAETQLRGALGARVHIKRDAKGEGEIRIAFQNDEDFQGLIKKIGGDYGLGL